MADSRFASIRHIQRKWHLPQKLSLIIIVPLIAWGLSHIIRDDSMSPPEVNALFLLLLAGGLWISEAIPPFAVSIFIIGFSVFFVDDSMPQVISNDWQKYTDTFSSPIIWILLGGFFLAIGAQITNFDKRFSKLVLSNFGNKPKNMLLGSMIVTGVLSMFMSNTATTAMMIAVIGPVTAKIDDSDPFIRALYIGVALAATLGGMGTVIGSPPNAIALGIINKNGFDIGFMEWMLVGAPIAILIIVLVWLLLINVYKTKTKRLHLDFHIPPVDDSNRNTPFNRAIVVITFTLTIGLWLGSVYHNIPVAVVSLIPVLTFTVFGVVGSHDLRLIPWDTLILVAGGLTLGGVIKDTGLAGSLVGTIPTFENLLLMALFLSWITMGLSNIMSNTAAASILIPIGVSLVPDHALIVAMCVGLSASTAVFLPISTPPNAIAFSTGRLGQADFRIPGIIIGIFAPILILIWTNIFFN